MNDKIKHLLQDYYEYRPYHKLSISTHGLEVLSNLPRSSFNLYIDLLKRVSTKCNISDIIINANHIDFGYNTRAGLSLALKPLKDNGLVLSMYGKYFINPNVTGYLTPQQFNYFKKLLGFSNQIVPKMGVPKPPIPIPKPPKE